MSHRRRFAAVTALSVALSIIAMPMVSAGARGAPARQHHAQAAKHPVKHAATHAVKHAADRAAPQRAQMAPDGSPLFLTPQVVTPRHGKHAAVRANHGHRNDLAGRSPAPDGKGNGADKSNGNGADKGKGKVTNPTRRASHQPTTGPSGSSGRFPAATLLHLPESSSHDRTPTTTPPRSKTPTPIRRSTDTQKPPPLADLLDRPLSFSMGLIPVVISILLAVGGTGLVVLTSRRTR